MSSDPKKGLFILSRILGLKTVTNQVVNTVDKMENIQPTYVYFDGEDYGRYRSWNPGNYWKNRFESAYCIREKVGSIPVEDYDFLFINGYELIYGLSEFIKRVPTVLMTDSTDVLSHALLCGQADSYANRVKTKIKDMLTGFIYRPVIKNIDVCMPISEWCAQSFVTDYGVARDRIVVTHCGFDMDHWRPSQVPRQSGKKRLLFVGNDLVRKGIYFLLRTYEKYLFDSCELVIVSTDQCIHSLPQIPGVKYIPGMENSKLVDLFTSCDLFVFPTYKDMCPNVLKEAAAAGLPLIARDVGGIGEVVQNGANGYLMPYASDEADWGKSILEMLRDENRLSRFGKAGRELAVRLFSRERFSRDLADAFEHLKSGKKQ